MFLSDAREALRTRSENWLLERASESIKRENVLSIKRGYATMHMHMHFHTYAYAYERLQTDC